MRTYACAHLSRGVSSQEVERGVRSGGRERTDPGVRTRRSWGGGRCGGESGVTIPSLAVRLDSPTVSGVKERDFRGEKAGSNSPAGLSLIRLPPVLPREAYSQCYRLFIPGVVYTRYSIILSDSTNSPGSLPPISQSPPRRCRHWSPRR